MPKAIYVLVVQPESLVYADMALVSILSLKQTNPQLPIHLVCDNESAEILQRTGHRLLGFVHELHPVTTPDGSATYRHRWIKTQLPTYVPGPALHLDADTLVRGSLSPLPEWRSDIAAVLDYNGIAMVAQLECLSHIKTAKEMGWEFDLSRYINCGVMYWQDNQSVRNLFADWHRLWLEGYRTRDLLLDQPSFNATLQKSLVSLTLLPNAYNTMIVPAWDLSPEALVWHFWSGCSKDAHSFARLVQQTPHLSTERLSRRIQRAIRFSRPWPNHGPCLARLMDRRGHYRGRYTSIERFWLSGDRRTKVQSFLHYKRLQLINRLGRPPSSSP